MRRHQTIRTLVTIVGGASAAIIQLVLAGCAGHTAYEVAILPFNDRHEDWIDMIECGVRIDSRLRGSHQ